MKIFRILEVAKCYRYVYIQAETEEEAIKEWGDGNYSRTEDWDDLDDDISIAKIVEF